jgi:acetoin utilization deacetylase AcuC-like enzyme
MLFKCSSRPQQRSFLYLIHRYVHKLLLWYWRFSLFIAGIILGTLASTLVPSWVQDMARAGHLTAPDITSLGIVLFHVIPPFVTILVVALMTVTTIFSWRAHRRSSYHVFLEISENNYRQVRATSGSIDMQLRIGREAMITLFDTQIYTERTQAVSVFDTFLGQSEKRIFLVVGRGGTGKSTFLQHRMGELSGALPSPSRRVRRHPCVYIDCKSERITESRPLEAIIADKMECKLDELVHAISGHGYQPLVIFIDAVNENTAQFDINTHLTLFTSRYLSGKLPIYLCMSVRKAYWDEQSHYYGAASDALGWLDSVYRSEAPAQGSASSEPGIASVQLDNYNDFEFTEAFARYTKLYKIEGHIDDPRTESICRNPLMLRMLCAAVRGQNITGRILLRDLDIFEEYANTALASTVQRIGISSEKPVLKGETLPQRVVRGTILELALGMVDRRRAFLTDDEVFEVLQKEVPDTLRTGKVVNSVNDLYIEGSVLKAVIDEGEGIVLEQGEADISRKGRSSGIRFVHERYFEYSIGRALVRRWSQKRWDTQSLLKDFEDWMQRHDELLSEGFTNIRQGLGMAVLVAEFYPGLPQDMHYRLLARLAEDKNFTWNQLACLRMLQLRILNEPVPVLTEQRYKDIERLLHIIDEMGSKNDFVLRWDIERALYSIVDQGEQEQQAVLKHLQTWQKPTAPFSQRLFSTECLGYLFKQSGKNEYRIAVVTVLERVIDTPLLDFWIRRSLMFSINTMLDALDKDNKGEEIVRRIRDDILALAERLLRTSQSQWDRSITISILLTRDALHEHLERWLVWNWRDEKIWTCVNATLALEQACARGLCQKETIRLFQSLWDSQRYSPHVSWALVHVLGQAVACLQTQADVRVLAEELRKVVIDYSKAHFSSDERAESVLPDADTHRPVVDTSVVVIYDPEYAHTDLHNHPESKERVEAIIHYLDNLQMPVDQQRQALFGYVSPRYFHNERQWASEVETFLGMVHKEEWIHRVRELSEQLKRADQPDVVLESDLEVRAGSYEGACLAVRGAICGVDLVLANANVRLAIALLRPPGHLAGNKICIFNNIAIGARYAQQQGKQRIVIVDCDAHHGQSTHEIFYNDRSVVYFSTHQTGVHPGTGSFKERGSGDASGFTLNVPLPVGSGDRVYQEVLSRILQPLLEGFEPHLILVSMGLDAYYGDNFSQLEFSEFSYFALARCLLDYCQRHKGVGVVAALEGGYDLDAMGPCVLQFMRVFGEWTWSPANGSPLPGKPSRLDQYLSARDEQETAVVLTDDDREWLQKLGWLEASITLQSWQS